VDKPDDPLHHERRRGVVHITKERALMNKPRVGVIGLGSIGGGVAKSLLRAGFRCAA
jgi:phosphoglycerate dehydrogenase-like enzyme